METKHLAKYNKVWQKISTGEVLANALTLKPNEKLTDYRQIDKPVEVKPQAQKKDIILGGKPQNEQRV